MAGSIATSRMREKPLMVFDGECQFCRFWIARWQRATGDSVEYKPFQDAAASFPEVPPAEFEQEVKLVEPDGRVYGGAEAVFRLLCQGDNPTALFRLTLGLYRHMPGFAPVTEAAYRFVARHRMLASAATRLIWGHG